jgi:DNA-binding MarR family transcriptional regulator
MEIYGNKTKSIMESPLKYQRSNVMKKQNVETIVLKNAKTGVAEKIQHECHNTGYGTKHFWKADAKFFELLSNFSAAESKVLAYILQETQPTKNKFVGAYKTIARKLNCDVVTVRNTVKKMQESDMLAKTEDERVWMINPRLLVKGDIYVQARLMSEYDTLLNRPLSDLLITDGDGNDPLFLPREYSTPESISNVKMNFFKVYDSFFGVVSGLGGKESLVLDFLVCAMQSGNNMYVGTMKKIAVNINSSKATVQRAMDSLADKGFVAMQLDGVWLINPSMVIKGNRSKEKVLMDKFILIQREYDEKRKARKNSKRKEADKEKAAA